MRNEQQARPAWGLDINRSEGAIRRGFEHVTGASWENHRLWDMNAGLLEPRISPRIVKDILGFRGRSKGDIACEKADRRL